MNSKRLETLTRILKRDPDLQPTGHWIGAVVGKASPADVYLTRDELNDLIAIATVVEIECQRYGLEDMGGNHAEVLLRHIYGNTAATMGAKDASIETLQRKLRMAKRHSPLDPHDDGIPV
jgi:hypothetical protein